MKSSLRSVVVVSVLAGTAGAVDVTYTVAARSDVRARTPLPGDAATGLTSDLEVAPRAEVLLGFGTDFLAAQYAPVLLWREPQLGGRLLPLQRARLAWEHRWSRATLLVSEDGTSGTADLGALRPPDGSTPLTVSEVQTVGGIPYLRSASLLSLSTRPSDVVGFDLSGGFLIQGSEQRPDAMPLQWGPTASARVRVAVSRVDGLSTSATLLSARFVTGAEQQVVQLRETWDRRLSRTLTLNLGAGLAFTRQLVFARALTPTEENPNPGVTPPPSATACTQVSPYDCRGFLPVGTGSLTWRDTLRGQPLRLDGLFSVAPFADRFTGNVYERMELRGTGEWLPEKRWSVRAGLGGASVVPVNGLAQQAGDRLVFGDVSAAWTPQPWLVLQASGRVLWTQQPSFAAAGQPVPETTQAVAAVSVTVQQTDTTGW